MSERLEALLAALVTSGTVWLTLGLAAAWRLRRRPARAHGILTLAAAGSLATPWLVVAVQQADWGVLPAARIEIYAHTPAPASRPAGLAAANDPRELHPVPPPFARPEGEPP